MTPVSTIDTHLHLWDPERLRYPWLDGAAHLNRPFLLADYHAATEGCAVDGMVFVQCETAPDDALREAEWITELAREEPRILGIVSWAPLEKGSAAEPELERLATLPLVRGIRRIIQFEPDPAFCLQPDFIAGVRLLCDFDWRFDVCVDWPKLPQVIELAHAVPDVPLILDHLGKPPVASGETELWERWLRKLAQAPNVSCKISGVATEADHRNWTIGQLQRYVLIALDAFGPERVMFGGDWPVATQAIDYRRWVDILAEVLRGRSETERRRFWRENAIRFYGLEV